VCEQLGRVGCRRPFGVRGRKKERNGNWIWELVVEAVTHPWREAGCCTQPIGGACGLSGSNRHYHAGIDGEICSAYVLPGRRVGGVIGRVTDALVESEGV
jgi:hypothetical protein